MTTATYGSHPHTPATYSSLTERLVQPSTNSPHQARASTQPREHFDDSMGRAAQPTGDHGLEWKDGHIYIASPPSQFVHVVDASTWKEVHRFKAPGYRVHGIAFAEEEGHMWVSDTSFGVVCRQRIEDGRCYDVFRVPHPVQVHGMTIRDNRLWYADDRGPIGWLSVSMEPDF